MILYNQWIFLSNILFIYFVRFMLHDAVNTKEEVDLIISNDNLCIYVNDFWRKWCNLEGLLFLFLFHTNMYITGLFFSKINY